jgi:hypothetical protein
MSSEELRQAAGLMRERAEAASAGPWERFGMAGVAGKEWEIVDERRVECECGEPVALLGCATNQNAEHIASWHPAVALAVANWLDGVALFMEAKDDEEYFDLDGDPIAPEDTHAIGSALAVARAYLGTAS